MTKPTISLIVSCSIIEQQVRSAIEAIQQSQPVASVELFLVSWEGFDYSSIPHGFYSVTSVQFSRMSSLNVGRAQAVRMATADIVVVTEDHARFLGPWVNRLPAIFAEHDADAVGWTAVPHDREKSASWSGYLVEYGIWGPGVKEGYMPHLPGHNCAYRRSALMKDPSMLEHYLQAEFFLHTRLGELHRSLYFTTEFTLDHAQFLSLGKFLLGDFWYGWGFGYTRQQVNRWGLGQRLLYAMAIPLKIPLRWMILIRMPKDPSVFVPGLLLKNSIGITLGYLVGAMGEFCSYIAGAGTSHRRLTLYEIGFDRSKP